MSPFSSTQLTCQNYHPRQKTVDDRFQCPVGCLNWDEDFYKNSMYKTENKETNLGEDAAPTSNIKDSESLQGAGRHCSLRIRLEKSVAHEGYSQAIKSPQCLELTFAKTKILELELFRFRDKSLQKFNNAT